MNHNSYEDELLNILESNIKNKRHYIESLISLYPNNKIQILGIYDTWTGLDELETVAPSKSMDDNFYKNLKAFEVKSQKAQASVISIDKNKKNVFSLRMLGIAMTFLLGMAIGGFFDFFNNNHADINNPSSVQQNSLVKFASLQETPLAADRIRGIIKAKKQENPNHRILEGLNNVICNDPNVNVRLSAIETLVLFWDVPRAREILIKAIPIQQSPIVQLELADIMISMEALNSSDKWNQLLSSGVVEPDIKEQLHNTLKEIL